jgi:hypothetical protein
VAIEIKALNKNKSNSNKLQLLYYLKSFSHTKGLTSSNFISCGSGDYITFEELQKLFDQSQQIERLFRRMTEVVLASVINRHIELLSLTIEERYKTFCKHSPHLLQLVPHKYIASYLGINPTNFSKLFNTVKI